jgi:hypothetical protein
MPATRASCGFIAVARIARPSVLRFRKRCSADHRDRGQAEHEDLVGRDAQPAHRRARHQRDRDLQSRCE